MDEFQRELSALINKHNIESISNTPDYILAMYLRNCLDAWNVAVQQRETWYGRDARPGSLSFNIHQSMDKSEK